MDSKKRGFKLFEMASRKGKKVVSKEEIQKSKKSEVRSQRSKMTHPSRSQDPYPRRNSTLRWQNLYLNHKKMYFLVKAVMSS